MDLLAQALMQGLLIGGTYGIIALGMGLTYGVSGVVNFAHGDFLTLGMFLALALFSTFSLDPYISVIVTFPLLVLLGAAVYYLLIRPVVGGHVLMVIQLTLGISFILQNGLLMIFGGRPQRAPAWIEAKLLLLGDVIVVRASLVIAFIACVVLSGFLYWLLTRTDLGRSIRAVHQNPKAAALMGVNVGRVRMTTFAIGIGILALSAALLVPGTPLEPGMGLRYTVIALMTVILGGMTNFFGILLGGLVLGVSEAIGTVYLPGTTGMIVPYAIFILILLLRPKGILGRS
ncbi:MAG: branched-chain amino acid ABC transporter permease [Xanthobacteraceae bacterium]